MENVSTTDEGSVEPEIVGDVTGEDLLADALDRLAEAVARAPDLDRDAGEFASRDVQDRLGWGESYAKRKLASLVATGKLEKFSAIDPLTGFPCNGYRWKSAESNDFEGEG